MYPAPTHSNKVNDDLRAFQGGGGYCLRCGRPWAYIDPKDQHTIQYGGDRRGMFVMCQPCHQAIFYNETERIGYYLKMIEHWMEDENSTVSVAQVIDIIRAVLEDEEFNDGLGGRSL